MTVVRALPISRYLEMPRETVRRHIGRLVALGLFERAEDQTLVPTKQLREVEIEGRYDCFARERQDYCEYRLACPIVLDTRKNANREASIAPPRGPASRFVERPKSGRSAYWSDDLQKAHVWGFKISLDRQTPSYKRCRKFPTFFKGLAIIPLAYRPG